MSGADDLPLADRTIRTIVRVARTVGEHAAWYQTVATAGEKLGGDIVTTADTECVALARALFAESEFEYGILGEDFGDPDAGSDSYWLVDPIDGTRNYSTGNPLYCSAFALVRDGELDAACIHAPGLDETYVAKRGRGAFLNGRRLQVSETAEPDDAHYTVAGTWRGEARSRYEFCDALPTHPVTDIFCGQLKLAFLAAGRVDAGAVGTQALWDVAPGILLIEEAGGRVEGFDGGSDWLDLHGGRFVASNGAEAVHDLVTDVALGG